MDEADLAAFEAARAVPIETLRTVTLGSSRWSGTVSVVPGTNTIAARSVDRAGNYSEPVSVSVQAVVDVDNPTVTITSPANGATIATRSILVSGQSTDAYTARTAA